MPESGLLSNMLSQSFFNRPTLEVASDLVGKKFVKKADNGTQSFLIHEVEAYDGMHDFACHARVGKTKRTEPMFGPAGHFYIYLIYGMYWMLNVVVGPKDYPAALLIRGVGQFNGPGKLTKHLGITNSINGLSATRETGFWFEDAQQSNYEIIQTPRIGVSYAGPIWSQKPYRFVLQKTQ